MANSPFVFLWSIFLQSGNMHRHLKVVHKPHLALYGKWSDQPTKWPPSGNMLRWWLTNCTDKLVGTTTTASLQHRSKWPAAQPYSRAMLIPCQQPFQCDSLSLLIVCFTLYSATCATHKWRVAHMVIILYVYRLIKKYAFIHDFC